MSLRDKTLDERECKDMLDKARELGWGTARLEFSHHSLDWVGIQRWIKICGKPDCGDAGNGHVIIEIKEFSDAMNWEHLIMQIHKMLWTGLKVVVIIRNYYKGRYKLVKTGVFTHEQISYIEHRIQVKCWKLGVPVFYCGDIDDTFNRMEYIFEHHDELPKPVNTWYLYKGDVEKIDKIRMIAVVHGIGIKRARVVPDPGAFMDDARKMELEDFQANYRGLENWGNTTCKRFWEAMQ
jgi:hypothetical protein